MYGEGYYYGGAYCCWYGLTSIIGALPPTPYKIYWDGCC